MAALIYYGLSALSRIGEGTVESYVSSILAKLGFTAGTQIATTATRGLGNHQ